MGKRGTVRGSAEEPPVVGPTDDHQNKFAALAAECEGELYSYALWYIRSPSAAQDVVQDALVRAWRSEKTPMVSEEFRAWLFRIVGNVCRTHTRRQRIQAALRFWAEPAPDPLEEFERRQGDPELAAALRSLNHRERVAIHLHFYQDRSHADIAAALDMSEGASRVLLHRAIEKLRGLLSASVTAQEASA